MHNRNRAPLTAAFIFSSSFINCHLYQGTIFTAPWGACVKPFGGGWLMCGVVLAVAVAHIWWLLWGGGLILICDSLLLIIAVIIGRSTPIYGIGGHFGADSLEIRGVYLR